MSATAVRAAESGEKPRRYGTWYVTEHKLRGMKAWGAGVFANAVANPVLQLFVFGVGLATLVSKQAGPSAVDGVGYLQFVTPALLCASLLQISAEEAMFTIQSGFKWNPIFIAMRAAPISSYQVFNGTLLALIVRLLATGVIFYVVALLFGAMTIGWSLLAIPIGILGGLAFGLPVMVYTTQMVEDRGQFNIVNRFMVLPMTLFSGTMFPLAVLPIWLQWVGWVSPLWHASQLARAVSYGTSEVPWLVAVHLAFLAIAAAVGWVWALRNAKRRLEK